MLRYVRLLPSRSSAELVRGLAPAGAASGVGLSLSGSLPALGRRFCGWAGSWGHRGSMLSCGCLNSRPCSGAGGGKGQKERGGPEWAWVSQRPGLTYT